MNIFKRLFSSPSTSKAELTADEVVDKLRSILTMTKTNYPNLLWASTLAGLGDDRIDQYAHTHIEDKPVVFLSLFYDFLKVQTIIHAQQAIDNLDPQRAQKYFAVRERLLKLLKELVTQSPDCPKLAYEKVHNNSRGNPGLTNGNPEQVIRCFWKEFTHPSLVWPVDV